MNKNTELTKDQKTGLGCLAFCGAFPCLGIPLAVHLGSWAMGIACITIPMLILGVIFIAACAQKEAKGETQSEPNP